MKDIKVGVPQTSMLGLILDLLYTSDILKIKIVTIATFDDDTAISWLLAITVMKHLINFKKHASVIDWTKR